MSVLREIVFDTETTGLDPASGDRVVEIGVVELLNHIPTGRVFHRYLNPQRLVAVEALAVHGLSDEFLSDKQLFAAVAEELHTFFGDAKLVAHNAAFDLAFLNAEFARTGHAPLAPHRIIDTLALARRKHPGASNSLDALCLRYGIDAARRTKHGALLDSELLAEIYIELIGGRQPDLGLAIVRDVVAALPLAGIGIPTPAERPSIVRISSGELAAHADFIGTLGPNALWADYMGTSPD